MIKAPRVVIDTNIVISSLWGGNARKIIDSWVMGKILAVISAPVLSEYTEVLSRFVVSEEDMENFMEIFMDSQHSVFVKPDKKIDAVRKDKKDNIFVECAVAGSAKYIVSGDNHLLDLKVFNEIQIVTAVGLLKLI